MPEPIFLESGQEFTFTIKRGVGTATCVSVNYDDFVNDVEVGDMLLVDGMLILHSFSVLCCSSLFAEYHVVSQSSLKPAYRNNINNHFI